MSTAPHGRKGDCDPDWADAILAAAALSVAPSALKGAVVTGWPGPARDRWIALVRQLMGDRPWAKVPLGVGLDRLVGGLDLTSTLRAGRAVLQPGLLTTSDGGVIVLPGAEQVSRAVASTIAASLDTGRVAIEREGFGLSSPASVTVLAFDEGRDEDGPRCPAILAERLALQVRLPEVPVARLLAPNIESSAITAARALFPHVVLTDDILHALCEASVALGIASLRAPAMAADAARALAALDGRREVDADDAATAARLVLAPRATRLPNPPEPPQPEQQPPPPEQTESATDQNPEEAGPAPDDIVLASILAALPAGLLERLLVQRQSLQGRGGSSGAAVRSRRRGRPAGVRSGIPKDGDRVDLIGTLRAAAPWQSLRRAEQENPQRRERVLVRAGDLKIRRFTERSETVTIFAVDASGSAALERLGEAKGAVELLLADCYVRRDKVALLAFRKTSADILLPPTRSLVRAKRALRDLAGGGGTPVALGLDAARTLAEAARRQGLTPSIVLLTDGRANIDRTGNAGRAASESDAMASAQALARSGVTALVIDTAARPQPFCRTLADAMRARYLALPHADAHRLAASVRALTGSLEAPPRAAR